MAFDAAVVGAGPAGAWAAYLLARAGARVAIFDASHPREKPCGGGITARALSLVADAIDISALPCVDVALATFRDATGRVVDVPLAAADGARPLIVASRQAFDTLLLDAAIRAGASHIRSRVLDVRREKRRFTLTTQAGTFDVDHVMGADGANSLVRRRMARPFSKDQLSIATGYFACGATSNAIVLEIVPDPPGYLWSFPRPDHLAIGICAQADSGAGTDALRARARTWTHDSGVARGAHLIPYAWPIPSLTAPDLDELQVAGTGWMLLGDAAGIVDPITREGIYFALDSARLAVDALADGRMPERTYSDALHADALEELSYAARLKTGFFKPQFAGLLLTALERSARVRRIMADLAAGSQPYRSLKWRLARTLEIRLAFEALAGP